MRVDPAQHGADASGLLATLGAGDLIDHNASPDRRRLIGLVIPEVESVDAVVREPKAALMRMVHGLPLTVSIGKWRVTIFPVAERNGCRYGFIASPPRRTKSVNGLPSISTRNRSASETTLTWAEARAVDITSA